MMMTFREYNGFCRSAIFVITFLLSFIDTINSYDLFEGNVCHFPNNDVGICRKINECNSIYAGLLDRTVDYGSVVRCSFVRNVEVICCPDGAKEALVNMPDPTEEPGNNYAENHLQQSSSNRDRSIDKPRQGLNPDIVNSLKDREFIDLAALVNKASTTTTQNPNDEYNVQMGRFVPQGPPPIPGTNILNMHPDLGDVVEVFNPAVITNDRNLQILGPHKPFYEHNNIMVTPTNHFPPNGANFWPPPPPHTAIPSNPSDHGQWGEPNNLPTKHFQDINNPNIIIDPWNRPIPNSALSSTQKPINIPDYVSTQKTLLDPWMKEALNTRNRSRSSTEPTAHYTPKPITTDFNTEIQNNQKPTEKTLLDPWMVNALNSALKPSTESSLSVGTKPKPIILSPLRENGPKTTTTMPPVLDSWMAEALNSAHNSGRRPSTEPPFSVTSKPKPIILSPIRPNDLTTTELPAMDPWIMDALNSAHNSARRPSTEPSLSTTFKRNSTVLSPVRENKLIPTKKSVIDPWMEEGLNSADNSARKPLAESFVSATSKQKSNNISALNGSSRIPTEKSVIDPWMEEALNSAHNSAKKSPHETGSFVSTTPKRTILKPVRDTISTTTDNSAFDPWMLDALNSATKPQLKPSTERSFSSSSKSKPTTLSPTRTSKQISAEQPVLEPWMEAALNSAHSPTSKPPRRTSFSREQPDVSQPDLVVDRPPNPMWNSIPTTEPPILDPWMMDALKDTPTTTENPNLRNPWIRDTKQTIPTTKRVKSAPEHGGKSSKSLIFVDTNNVSTSTHLKYSKANNTETRGNGRIAELACAKYSEEAAPLLTFNIINGIPTKLGEFPHMAALGYPFSVGSTDIDWKCGGSLISDRFVLTAAHCISKDGPVVVRLGKVTLVNQIDGTDPRDYEIIETIRHPQYRTSAHYHDIALLRLNDSVEFGDFIRPACLSTDPNDMKPDTVVFVTGWGLVSIRTRMKSTVLLKANLTTVELSSCNSSHMGYGYNRKLQKGLDDGQLCAFDPALKYDSCEGDSGGPMQTVDIRGVSTIYGITSFGISCSSSIPGVYARVSRYLDWIESIVWPQGFV